MLLRSTRHPKRSAVCTALVTALVTVVSGALDAPSGHAAPIGCPQARVTVWSSTPGALGWAENIGFDDAGRLWVSRLLSNRVEAYDRGGRRVAEVSINAPGAIRLGPDGRMYVTSGNTPTQSLPGARPGSVIAFDPDRPQPETHAAGLGQPNGLAFDPDGNAYVADGVQGLVRIAPDGRVDRSWTARARTVSSGPPANGISINGVAVDGTDLLVTLTVSGTGRVLRVPISQPESVVVAADATAPTPGLLDDLMITGPGRFAVSTVTGQIIVVDTARRTRCAIPVGQPVTAIARRPGDTRHLWLSTESGDLLSLVLSTSLSAR